ncbi:error-prone DNA polymerase [Thauera sp.]|jgi:error-prone DNA polymerase|uniref:error-prone DNA polymerase n=1 Tax=Thauera sp. TaxID=1905334 RepID=UPI002A364420|nr:error-prone DNA polymerase [Thauera sp.]MDX9885411.1 error-prone DNA polymerase [Thauera sp.]
MKPPYAELHCLSNFSFQRGASHPEELVTQAAAFGYAAIALTDECSFAGIVRAHRALQGLPAADRPRLIIGSELQLADGPRLVLLATDRTGYGQLSRLITVARRAAGKGEYLLTRDMIDSLPGCLALLVPPPAFPPRAGTETACASMLADAEWLAGRFPGRAWMTVTVRLDGRDRARITLLRRIARSAGIPALAASGALMHAPERRPLADVMTALRLHCSVAEAGLALAANAEQRLHDREALARRYPPALLAETLAVAERCTFSLDELRYEYPAELVPAGETPTSWLRRLLEGGLAWRYRKLDDTTASAVCLMSPATSAAPPSPTDDPAPPPVRAQIEHELALIAELGYEPYFLTVHDIVRFARAAGILCQGRGSAANSVVCWALGITEVDPQLGIMLVERFISRERNEPPDIDVDFEHDRREEVIQYIYRKYGRERAALAATVISYRSRSALRDVGRALGLDEALIERLTREHHWFDGRHILPERLAEAGLDPASPVTQRLVALTEELIGFPRHLSQHVGGFVIARGRLDELVPVENAAMADRTVIQWDKDDLDAVGLMKIDVLALGMLSALRRGLALVSAWRGRPLTLATIPRERPEVYEMLTRADSVGVFQVESRAQMTMLPRLKPRRFYDLVVEVAIVRPGPIQGGMVHPYLQARERVARGEEPMEGLREEIRGVLARTLGVPIFQEQVMQLAVVAADFSGGEADQLRRAMGAWRRKGELERYRQKLLDGLADNGYDPDFAQRLCQQIEGFGSYGFPESHAASFALLVYASAWLKCFEPAAFLAALLNSQPMGFYAPSQLIQDARRHGVEVRAADVTVSEWDCTLEPATESVTESAIAPAVRLGLRMIRGLAHDAAARIAAARSARAFTDVQDLAARARLDAGDLRTLAAGGALATLAGHRRQALWQASGAAPLPGLLADAPGGDVAALLAAPAEAEDLLADYARLGFTLGRHPLSFVRDELTRLRFLTAADIAVAPDRMLARGAGLVTCRQRPGTAKGTLFVTLEDETGLTNVIVRPELFELQRRILLGARLMGVFGQISRQGRVVHLVANRVVDHSPLLGSLAARSRDFH